MFAISGSNKAQSFCRRTVRRAGALSWRFAEFWDEELLKDAPPHSNTKEYPAKGVIRYYWLHRKHKNKNKNSLDESDLQNTHWLTLPCKKIPASTVLATVVKVHVVSHVYTGTDQCIVISAFKNMMNISGYWQKCEILSCWISVTGLESTVKLILLLYFSFTFMFLNRCFFSIFLNQH